MERRSMNGLTEQHEPRLFCFCPTVFYFMRTLGVLGSFWHKESSFKSKQTQTKARQTPEKTVRFLLLEANMGSLCKEV